MRYLELNVRQACYSLITYTFMFDSKSYLTMSHDLNVMRCSAYLLGNMVWIQHDLNRRLLQVRRLVSMRRVLRGLHRRAGDGGPFRSFFPPRAQRCTVYRVGHRVLGQTLEGSFCKILQFFSGLVLGCIKTKFCKKICV